jgi:sortase (surface protein transpeptidase)
MLTSFRRPVPRARRVLVALAALTVIATVSASSASALSVRRNWHASIGTAAANGTARLTAYWTGEGVLLSRVVGLRPSTTYPVIVYRGSCSSPVLIARMGVVVTDATGAATKTTRISIRTMNAIWAYARTSTVAIKFGAGGAGRCGTLTFAVATRVAIPGLRIDLPIVRPSSGYPLCNVAMYIRELSQPREAGVTLIYAHARKGMFLPLLERSKINNGASLIGATVRVWTSDDVLSTYKITTVRRHVTSLDGVFGIGPEQLWLQTSEGPRGTVAKLIVVAKRVSSVPADHAAAHPTPHPVVCR